MKAEEIKKIAQKMGVPAVGPKAEMIKSIQRTEGNFDCFGTAVGGFCDQTNCLWSADCLKPAKKSQ
ncbi:MAG: SAP domain-containing protein [Nitrospira sp.]|nr:SAP domain-containing protein [Nitrospira sp.]